MAKIDDQLAQIQQSVLHEATAKSEALRKQADDFRKMAMDQAENEVLAELYSKIQDEISEIRDSSTQNISRTESGFRQKLLLRREELTQSVFDAVGQKLLAYTKTDDYKAWMLKLAKSLSEIHDYTNNTIMIRRKDYEFSVEIEKLFSKGCRILADDGIRIGGIKLMNQSVGIFVDETLDAKLEDQRPWFYSHSQLAVQ